MNSSIRSRLLGVCLACFTAACHGASEANWPQFRGPLGRGASPEPGLIQWNVENGENIRWQTPVPGLGHAAPILWGGRIYLATAVREGAKAELKLGVYGDVGSFTEKEPEQWHLLCLDEATGKVLWDKKELTAVPREPRHTKGSHCNSTPATDGEHLVAILGAEGLFCFDLEGKLLWRKDLGKMDAVWWASPSVHWGFASSPVLYDGKVIVQCDVLSDQYVAAFDVHDGHQLWRTARAEISNFCTPAVDPEAGEVVLNGWRQIAGYDVATGKLLWQLTGGGDVPVPAPVTADGLAFLTSAHGKSRPIRAVRLDSRGNIDTGDIAATNSAVIWSHPRLGSYMQTPIVIGPWLFSCDWLGVLSCIETRTGRLMYSERLDKGGQAWTASPVAAGDRLYFANEGGEVVVVAAAPPFKILGSSSLGAPCLATPAVSKGTVYFRTTEKLIAVGPKGSAAL